MSARHGSGKQPSIENSAGGTVPRLAAVSAILYWLLTVVTGLTVISTGKYSYQNDSTAHWLRVEQLRAGTIVPQLSQDFPEWVVKNDNGIIKPFNNTAVNSPFAYLPSLIIQGDYKASSIATLLITSGIIALAIWLAREFRYAILATAILPMTFFSLTFPTADAMINSISLLFIAVVLCCYQSTRFGWLHIGILSVLAAMLGQVKITCILVSFFVFVLLGKAKKIPLKIALVVPVMASIASMAMWNRKVAHIATAPSHVSIEQISQLKKQMMADPFSLIGSWFQTFFEPLTVDTEKIDGRLVNAGRNLQFFAGTEAVQLANAVVIPVLLAIAILVIVGASAELEGDRRSRIGELRVLRGDLHGHADRVGRQIQRVRFGHTESLFRADTAIAVPAGSATGLRRAEQNRVCDGNRADGILLFRHRDFVPHRLEVGKEKSGVENSTPLVFPSQQMSCGLPGVPVRTFVAIAAFADDRGAVSV